MTVSPASPSAKGPEGSVAPGRVASSALLRRIAQDLLLLLQDGGTCPWAARATVFVEAVTPRRIGAFRAGVTAPGHEVRADTGLLRQAAESVERSPWIRRCVSVPPNLYFDLERDRLNELICEELAPERGLGYVPDTGQPVKGVNIAFCSPNANKPLHLGHARNMLLGAAIGNLLELSGVPVYRSCCLSDYGVHIFKALAAYVRAGGNSTPESTGEKGDHFVGRFYAQFAADRSLAHGPCSPQELSARWMDGDPEVRDLTSRLTSWAETGFDRTFADWRVRFDHRFYETEEHAYIDGFVERQLAHGTLRKDELGRLVVDLSTDPPQAVPLLRSDGSPLYMSHMVAAILQRLDVFGPRVHSLMALTGEEQVVPFRQLTAILERFGYGDGVEIRHLTHGLVYADGAGLSSREGTALTLDHVVERLAEAYVAAGAEDLAELRARSTLALYVLGRPPDKPLHFSEEQCLRSGRRVLDDVAETLRATKQRSPGPDAGERIREFRRSADEARFDRWAARLSNYPLAIERAVNALDPSVIANYVATLCRDFVLLRRACRSANSAQPAEFVQLFPPTFGVVDHALRVLNVDADGVEQLGASHARRRPEAALR